MPKAIVRNAMISGALIFLIFVVLKLMANTGAENMDNIGDTRSMLLFLNGFFFPGFFFGIAMILALPEAAIWKKVTYVLASTVVHIIVAYSGVEGDLFLLATASLAGPTMIFLTNGLLWPGINTVRQGLIALPISAVAVMPLYYTFSTMGDTVEAPTLLGFTSFFFWPVFMSYVLTRFRWPQAAK
ncbi:MAG: hypothetical protein KDC34_03475 [Saprospiraceae bacterium]|nr:hypothetical protein [Saprospiraceae bacterium]